MVIRDQYGWRKRGHRREKDGGCLEEGRKYLKSVKVVELGRFLKGIYR